MAVANELSRRRFLTSTVSAVALAALPNRLISGAEMQTAKGDAPTMLTPYLLFDGTCRPAMEFYKHCFGGELSLTKVKDSPAKDHLPAFQQEKVVNAHLKSAVADISASDWLRPAQTPIRGNTVCLYLSGGTYDELKSLFARLSEGGDVTDPLKEEFFGVYGALNDKFGVRWMFQTNQKDERTAQSNGNFTGANV